MKPWSPLELEELLLDEGFEVVGSAANAAQAIDLGRRHRPDVALLDLNLSNRLTGPRIAKTLVHERLATVVFVTGQANSTTGATCMERSASSRSPVLARLWLKPYGSGCPICCKATKKGCAAGASSCILDTAMM